MSATARTRRRRIWWVAVGGGLALVALVAVFEIVLLPRWWFEPEPDAGQRVARQLLDANVQIEPEGRISEEKLWSAR